MTVFKSFYYNCIYFIYFNKKMFLSLALRDTVQIHFGIGLTACFCRINILLTPATFPQSEMSCIVRHLL